VTDRAKDDNDRADALARIAETALEEMDCAREHERWMAALFQAIRVDLVKGDGHVAKELAGLGQYLSDRYCNVLDEHVRTTDEQMSALGQRS
jgi:hypothetical protein